MAVGDIILRVENLSMVFSGLAALEGLSMYAEEGRVTSLIGPNGAGKTTALNVISGVLAPTGGSVRCLDRDTTGWPPHRINRLGLSRTFQHCQVFGNMTVLENVMMGFHASSQAGFFRCLLGSPAARRGDRELARRALEILRLLGLEDYAEWPGDSLPYGEQKRLEIGRALAGHPRVLLLDEPASGLNPQETVKLARSIEALRGVGPAVLLVEHDMNLVMGISDRVVVLDYGRKIAEGTPDEIQRNERVLGVYLGDEL